MASITNNTPQQNDNKKQKTPKLLHLLPYESPLLRKPSATVTFPLNHEDSELVNNMLYSVEDEQLDAARAPWQSAAGMAAPQWGYSRRIFVMRRKYFEGDDCCFSELGGSSVTGGGSCGALGGSGNFVVALNPEYVGVMCDNELTDTERLFMAQNIEAEGEGVDKQCEKWESEICDTEGCFSVPYKRGVVRRFHAACLLLSTVLFVRCCCGVGRLACSNMRPIIWRDDFTMIQWLLGVCPSPMCRWSSGG